MNLALFAHSGMFRSIQTLLRWWTVRSEQAHHNITTPAQSVQQFASISAAGDVAVKGTTALNKVHPKPLRVVRVVETGQSVGRIVISGRMADVCAELDRLAACEAALS
jgi:hypothetical protein